MLLYDFQQPDICKACGGRCCKKTPGIAIPEDFGPDLFAGLTAAFKSGKWAVDWYEGFAGGPGWYVRPAMKKANRLFDPAWGGGECVFLGTNGCDLPHDYRPTGCRSLEPGIKECIEHLLLNKFTAATLWSLHITTIDRAANAAKEAYDESFHAGRNTAEDGTHEPG